MKEINMGITIEFFQEDLLQAIGAGIYEISVYKDDKAEVLYIGESVYVLVRCALHLYELNKNPTYFGFTSDTIIDSNVKLKFRLIENISNKNLRKKREIELIHIHKMTTHR